MSKSLEIAQLGEDILRVVAQPVQNIESGEILKVIEALFATLADSEGVGLAAPQIFAPWRMMLIASRPTERYPLAPIMEPTLMINPSFEVMSTEQQKDWEGCLSIPGIRAKVPRYTKIKVRYMNRNGDWIEAIFEDFLARIFQHEYDHLEGLVYLDRLDDNRDIIAETEFFKLMG